MRARLIAPLLLVLAVAAPGAQAAGSDRPRELNASSCTTVKYADRSHVLFLRGVSCADARRWVNQLARSSGRSRPAGYRCSSADRYRSGGYCERGNRHFGWHTGN